MYDLYTLYADIVRFIGAFFISYLTVAAYAWLADDHKFIQAIFWPTWKIMLWLKNRKMSRPINPITLLLNEMAEIKVLLKQNIEGGKTIATGGLASGPTPDPNSTTTSGTTTTTQTTPAPFATR